MFCSHISALQPSFHVFLLSCHNVLILSELFLNWLDFNYNFSQKLSFQVTNFKEISRDFTDPFTRSLWVIKTGFIIGKDNLCIENQQAGMVGGWEGLTVISIQTIFSRILVAGSSGKGGGNWNSRKPTCSSGETGCP